ncbi:MAG TPA: glycosyltransferase family A protein [Flavobacteriales bacterium]|nr:glycosyltransferase family A protein [Flavobacteriales bacterium]
MRISVIIPCYNVERYVERAVRSVLAQTHPDIELIVGDDGSTDGTRERLRALKEELGDRITVLEQENRGACAARNTGLAKATGELVQFLDADDVLLPSKLAHQASVAERSGRPAPVIGSSRIIDPVGNSVRTVVQQPGDRDPWMDLMSHGLNITSTNLWKRAAVEQAGGWREGLGSSQEYDLMFRMLQQGARVVHDPEVLTEIHQRPGGSISQTGLDRNWERFVDLRVRIVEHLRKTRPDLDLQPYLQVLFDSIRTLYLHAPDRAVALYKSHMPRGFVPQRSPATGKGYLFLHRLFGFSWANRLRGLLRRG